MIQVRNLAYAQFVLYLDQSEAILNGRTGRRHLTDPLSYTDETLQHLATLGGSKLRKFC